MSKKNGKKELMISSVVAGLLMGGTAMASLKGAETNAASRGTPLATARGGWQGEFFKIKELKSGYRLAKDEKSQGDEKKAEPGKTTGEKACTPDKSCAADKKCVSKDKGDKHCCDKTCGDKKSSGDKKSCGEKACGEKACG